MKFIKDWGFNKAISLLITIWRFWSQQAMVAIVASLLIVVSHQTGSSQPTDTSNLPMAEVHPLPGFLSSREENHQGDYFNQIESTPLGYLVWSKFPLKVYVDSIAPENTAANQRFQQWTQAARNAIAEWNVYFPLQEVETKTEADILILRSQPRRKAKFNRETGLYDIPRAVTAQTNYKFYLTKKPTQIALRMTVQVSPNYAGFALLATIRHELGHALGIWGHSPNQDDALYFSQVSNPPSISPRDLNTLKKIYQQPTRLGWKIKNGRKLFTKKS